MNRINIKTDYPHTPKPENFISQSYLSISKTLFLKRLNMKEGVHFFNQFVEVVL